MLKKMVTLLFIIAFLPIIVLGALNSDYVVVDYFFGEFSIKLSWLVILAFVLGIISMIPFFAMTGYYWKIKANKLYKQLESSHKEQAKKDIAKKYQQD